MLIGILLIFYMKMTSRGSLLGGWGLDDAPACIPAPPPESLPAIVKTFLTCWWWLSTSMMVLLNGSKGSRFNSQRSLWLFLVICLSQWRWYSCSMTILIGFLRYERDGFGKYLINSDDDRFQKNPIWPVLLRPQVTRTAVTVTREGRAHVIRLSADTDRTVQYFIRVIDPPACRMIWTLNKGCDYKHSRRRLR